MKFLCFTSSTQNPNISNLKHAIKANKNEPKQASTEV